MNPVTQYDQPAQAKFINTYVPLNVDMMFKAAAAKQQGLQQGQAALTQTENLIDNVIGIPNTPDDAYTKYAKETVRNLVDKYSNKDLSDIYIQKEFTNELHNKIDPARLQRINASYQNYLKSIAHKAQMGPAYNPTLDEDLKLLKKWDSSDGVYTFDPARTPFDQPLSKVLDPYFRELDQPIDIGKRDKYGRIAYGRTQADVDKVIQQYAEALTLSPTGMAKIKQYAMQHPELADKSSVDIAKALMNDYGQKYIGTKRWGAAAPAWARKGPGQTLYNPFSDQYAYTQTGSTSDVEKLSRVESKLKTEKAMLDQMPKESIGTPEYNRLKADIEDKEQIKEFYDNKIDQLINENLNNPTFNKYAEEAVKNGYTESKQSAINYLVDLIKGKEKLIPTGLGQRGVLNQSQKNEYTFWQKALNESKNSISEDKLNGFSEILNHYNNLKAKNLSSTSAAYRSLSIPLVQTDGVWYQVHSDPVTGKTVKVQSPLGSHINNLPYHLDEYNILSLDGDFNPKDKTVKKLIKSGDFAPENINVIIDPAGIFKEGDYSPKYEVQFRSGADKKPHNVLISSGKGNTSLNVNAVGAAQLASDPTMEFSIKASVFDKIPQQVHSLSFPKIGTENTITAPSLSTSDGTPLKYVITKVKGDKDHPYQYKIWWKYGDGEKNPIQTDVPIYNRAQLSQELINDYNTKNYQLRLGLANMMQQAQ